MDTARHAYDSAVAEAIRQVGLDPEIFIKKSMPQSELFMAELLPLIHRLFFSWPENAEITVLDVGPQTFSGTALLARLHHPLSFNQLKMRVSAVDIHDKFLGVKQLVAPDVEFILSDIFDLKRSWDLVICSHVIEHVDSPLRFMRQLQKIARSHVVLAAPWNEKPLVTQGHLNTIDKQLVRKAGGKDLSVFTNFSWGKSREVCVFSLDGLCDAR